MAIKNLFGRGIGFNDGQIGWVVTRGYGLLEGGDEGGVVSATICTPPLPSGVNVWMRFRTERSGYLPSAWTVIGPIAVGESSPALYSLSVSIAPAGTPTVIWSENPMTLGLVIEYEVHSQGTTPSYPNEVEVDAVPGQYALIGETVNDGERISVRVTPWTGYSGGSVSGLSGTARTAYRDMNEDPVGSGFSSGFDTGYGS